MLMRAPEAVYEVAPWTPIEQPIDPLPLTEEQLREQEEQAKQREREEYDARENALREQWIHEYREAER